MAMKEEILKSKTDSTALVELIERFAPLLNKYAKKLKSEDAYADLQLKFIEVVLRFDPSKMRSSDDPYILSYLSRAIHNHYIYLSKQERLDDSAFPISAFGDENGVDMLDKLYPPHVEKYSCEEFDFLYKNLTVYEADIIVAIYYYRYTVHDLARHYGVSSSAISQAKSNAIKKLKKALSKGGHESEL